jgi:hypothetical protein
MSKNPHTSCKCRYKGVEYESKSDLWLAHFTDISLNAFIIRTRRSKYPDIECSKVIPFMEKDTTLNDIKRIEEFDVSILNKKVK